MTPGSTIESQMDIWLASSSGEVVTIKKLLNNEDFDVNQQSRDVTHDTLLHTAAYSGQQRVIDLLVDHGADVDASTSNSKRSIVFFIYLNAFRECHW